MQNPTGLLYLLNALPLCEFLVFTPLFLLCLGKLYLYMNNFFKIHSSESLNILKQWHQISFEIIFSKEKLKYCLPFISIYLMLSIFYSIVECFFNVSLDLGTLCDFDNIFNKIIYLSKLIKIICTFIIYNLDLYFNLKKFFLLLKENKKNMVFSFWFKFIILWELISILLSIFFMVLYFLLFIFACYNINFIGLLYDYGLLGYIPIKQYKANKSLNNYKTKRYFFSEVIEIAFAFFDLICLCWYLFVKIFTWLIELFFCLKKPVLLNQSGSDIITFDNFEDNIHINREKDKKKK